MNRFPTAIIFTFLWSVFILAEGILAPRPQSAISSGIDITANGNTVPAIDTLIQSLINQTNLDTLIRHVNILSGEISVTINGSTYLILSRNANHPHNDLAADYLFQTLDRLGLPTYNQLYSSSGRNVYGVQVGTDYPEQAFIICAHYDDIPYPPSPAAGADDNASGVAAVLEAARILSQTQTPYTIIFALWDEEEIGLLGSTYFAQQAFQAGENILGVVNLDMLGWDGNNDGLIDIHIKPIAHTVELANLIEYLNNHYNIGLSPAIYNPGTNASDHYSFWNRGYSAVLLIEAYYGNDFNPFYHSVDDKIEHFNLGYFHALSKLAVATISHLSFYDVLVNLENEADAFALEFVLEQNYPNPFNSTTTIEFYLPHPAYTSLRIYNVLGQVVMRLVEENLPAGNHKYLWDGKDMVSGMYFYRLEAGSFVQTKKMLLIQ